MEIVIITGQSGAGKTQAIACMEDLGYYCVDNIPPVMITDLIARLKEGASIEKVAIVIDVRSRTFFSQLDSCLDQMTKDGLDYSLMFLEASDKALLMRYQETRRRHPLAEDGNTEAAIVHEREMLEALRSKANYIIDTTDLKSASLHSEIARQLNCNDEEKFRISIQSFGYKKGLPTEADWIFDVRFIPNPFYVESLKPLTGKDKEVKDFVLAFDETKKFIGRVTGLIVDLVPKYIREGKYHLTIAIGCTGGQHRSVVIAEELYEHLKECGQAVSISHREFPNK